MTWLFFWIISALCRASSDAITRVFSTRADSYLWTSIFSLWMFFSAFITFLFIYNLGLWNDFLSDKWALWVLFFSWLINGIGFIFFFKFFQNSWNLTQGIPSLLLFVLLISVIYGVLFFKDPINLRIIIGIIFAWLAVYLLAK